MTSDDWQCELCCEPIGTKPHVRIAGDIAIRDGADKEFVSLSDDEIMVFAMFHSKCLLETRNKKFSGDSHVLFLRQAREVIEKAELCEACDAVAHEMAAISTPKTRLTVLQGGVA